MKVLVTGAAGFIGFHVADGAAARAATRWSGLDIVNDYYDPRAQGGAARRARPHRRRDRRDWRFHRADLADRGGRRAPPSPTAPPSTG